MAVNRKTVNINIEASFNLAFMEKVQYIKYKSVKEPNINKLGAILLNYGLFVLENDSDDIIVKSVVKFNNTNSIIKEFGINKYEKLLYKHNLKEVLMYSKIFLN